MVLSEVLITVVFAREAIVALTRTLRFGAIDCWWFVLRLHMSTDICLARKVLCWTTMLIYAVCVSAARLLARI